MIQSHTNKIVVVFVKNIDKIVVKNSVDQNLTFRSDNGEFHQKYFHFLL